MNRDWQNALKDMLIQELGSAQGEALFSRYSAAFPIHYCAECSVAMAVCDIKRMEKLSQSLPIDINLYRDEEAHLHIRLLQLEKRIPLSDVLPMLENMDLRTHDEHPYRVQTADKLIWINDFTVNYIRGESLDIDGIKTLFHDAFINICAGLSENDGFNKLILAAGLSWREIIILRAYAKYLRQTGFHFSQTYIEQALLNNAGIAKDITQLFIAKFDPAQTAKDTIEPLETAILQALEKVMSLDEDRIARRMLDLVKATLRTNYFQQTADGQFKDYLSLKLHSRAIPEMPLPVPLYEIFVYSPRFEAIHLRNTKVARGGIRWSDRREDFRTEVLGLMKAQKVKNAVIVPSGAKGGFVLKALPPGASRETTQAEVMVCYKSFIRGLLDLTDNLSVDHGKVIKPRQVVCYDDDDTYLVVAADKGTATFSDTANSLSQEYQFWLGDAFASGGSVGYDHKKMGITARGAWESVKQHFAELGLNVHQTDFTVVGIGDMSGDVFGNGMIYTPHIKLVGAFDHRHIFIDPTPNAQMTYQERKRLFALPTSSWEDFNPELISHGGGVFKRSLKSIMLTPEMKKMLAVEDKSLTPNELIRALLKAPVDLLFNGGIGTYVKASSESHADVGDKTNEYCRVNGAELRCRVVGEGGNLGFTQLGRVEFALKGGLINTDFIDNSAGVDCSDHEVNIKILLNQEVNRHTIDEETRRSMLAAMTQEVADLVLKDNYSQALAMSIVHFNAKGLLSLHAKFIKDLEEWGILDRAVEFLPDEKELLDRKTQGGALSRPELAVLLAYSKIHLKNQILKSDIPEHPFFSQMLFSAFPTSLHQKYRDVLQKHRLHREIVATQLSNYLVNSAGIAYIYNMQNETGSSTAQIIRAYMVAATIFEAQELQTLIESLSHKIPFAMQVELLGHIRRLVYLSTRWFLRHKNLTNEDLQETINTFGTNVKLLTDLVPSLMGGFTKNYLDSLSAQFEKIGVSVEYARRIAATRAMYTSLNIIQVATEHHFDLTKTARVYFVVGEYFNLLWFRDKIGTDTREGIWETLARLTLRDELDILQKLITTSVMQQKSMPSNAKEAIDQWVAANPHAMERWEKILEMIHSSTSIDYSMFFIALRELSNLLHASELYA